MLVARRLLLIFLLPVMLAGSACSQGEVTALPFVPRDWAPSDYTLEATASAAAVQAGEPVTFRATVTAPTGEDISDAIEFSTEMSPSLGVLSDGDGQFRFSNVDTYTWFVSADIMGATLVKAVSLVVSPGPAASVDLQLSVPMVEAGVPVGFTARVFDAWGNDVEVGEQGLVHSSSPSATIAGGLFTAILSGSYTLTSTLADGTASDSERITVAPGDPASLDIALSSYDVERGQGVVVDTVVLDNFGNRVDYPVDVSSVPSLGTEAWANFVRFHREGEFTVHADITDYGLHAEDGPVLVDSTGPAVQVVYPPRGAELDRVDGDVITVSGFVSDALSGVSALSVNGDVVAVDGMTGAFSHDINASFGLNTLQIETTDGDDNRADVFQTFLWGDYTPQGDVHQDAVLARLNQGAFDALEDMVEGMITGGAIEAGLIGASLGSGLGGANLTINSVTLGNPVINLDPVGGNPEGHLAFYAEFSPLNVGVTHPAVSIAGDCVSFDPCFGLFGGCTVSACGHVWFSATGSGGASEIWVDTEVQLQPDPVEVIDVTVSNTATGISGSNLNINTNLWLELSGCGILCSALEGLLNVVLSGFNGAVNAIVNGASSLFSGLIDLILQGVLPAILDDQLAPLIEDALDGLVIETEIDLMGVPITLEALPHNIEIDDDGMLVALESSVTAPLSPVAPTTFGALYDIDSMWPSYSLSEDLHLSLEDGFINQLLHSAWQGGVMNMTMDAASLGLDLDQVSSILPLTYLEMSMQPLLPPLVGPKAGGGMQLSIGDLLINVTGDPGGVSGLMMQIAVTIVADADFTLDADDEIAFEFSAPLLYMDFVTATPWTVNGETVERVMDAVIGMLVPTLMDTLGGLGGFEMPELGGFAINGSTFVREPAPAAYLTISGDLTVQ